MKKYSLSSFGDVILKVPSDRIMQCMKEIADAMILASKEIKELKLSAHRDMAVDISRKDFIWTDEGGCHDNTNT